MSHEYVWVPIYRISFDDDLGKLYELDHVIIKEKENVIKVIITEYDDTDILHKTGIHDGVVDCSALNFTSFATSGYQLAVMEEVIQDKNRIISSCDIEKYLDCLGCSPFSDIYAKACRNYFQYYKKNG